LVGANENYNTYFKKEGVLNVSMERSFFGDKVGTLIGYEVAQLNYTTFDGNSLLRKQSNSGLVKGVKNNFITLLQLGIAYDTRDLEPDPSNGLFMEITDEISATALGSAYDFNKIYGHVNYYKTLLPKIFSKLVFAGRVGMGYIGGDAPFFEFQDQWSQEGDIEGLGGAQRYGDIK
jgi:outer membrane protein assembly factor BamA